MPFKFKNIFKKRSNIAVIKNVEDPGMLTSAEKNDVFREIIQADESKSDILLHPLHQTEPDPEPDLLEKSMICLQCDSEKDCDYDAIVPVRQTNEISQVHTLREIGDKLKLQSHTFRKLQQKISNIKTFYPEIYSMQGNIIEAYGQNTIHMSLDVLKYDENKSRIV